MNSAFLDGITDNFLFLLAGVVLFFIAAIYFKKNLFLVLLFFLVGFLDYFGFNSLIDKPIKIYFVDLFIFYIILYFFIKISKSTKHNLETKFLKISLIYFIVGIIPLLVGFLSGYSPNDIFGDFRRLYIYPFAILLPFEFLSSKRDVNSVLRVISLGVLIIAITAFARVITGKTWDPAQFLIRGDWRAISYPSGIFVNFIICVVYSYLLFRMTSKYKIYLYLALFILVVVVIFSGYRLLWVLTAFSIFLITLIKAIKLKNAVYFVKKLFIFIFLLVIVILLIKFIFPSRFEILLNRFYQEVLNYDFTLTSRYFAWRTAITEFLAHPIFGVGLGDQFSFWGIDSRGNNHYFEITTHNVILNYLYQTGLVGFLIFLFFQFNIFSVLIECIKKTNYSFLIIGFFVGLLSYFIMGNFQPTFENPCEIFLYYLLAGVAFTYSINVLKKPGRENGQT